MILATIRNDFHNTEVAVRVPDDGVLSPSQVRRVRSKLCGMPDCKCGGVLGERGRQDVEVVYIEGPDGKGIVRVEGAGASRL